MSCSTRWWLAPQRTSRSRRPARAAGGSRSSRSCTTPGPRWDTIQPASARCSPARCSRRVRCASPRLAWASSRMRGSIRTRPPAPGGRCAGTPSGPAASRLTRPPRRRRYGARARRSSRCPPASSRRSPRPPTGSPARSGRARGSTTGSSACSTDSRRASGSASRTINVRRVYGTALLDWLACAEGGRGEPAARAASGLGDGVSDRVAALGAAGHVLDFDDTHAPSLAHLSAPTAPAALVLGASLGATIGDVLDAYAAGFEVMGEVAAVNHPAIRARGWHPTAVCGVVGAAVSGARLLALGPDRTEHAVRLGLLRAGGLHAAFGSDGKALQVGMASAAGATAARLAAAGATAGEEVYAGLEAAFGARWPAEAPERDDEAIRGNWIK